MRAGYGPFGGLGLRPGPEQVQTQLYLTERNAGFFFWYWNEEYSSDSGI